MSKKVLSKAVAAILVAAMCMVAVFTGAVSAENRTATCTVTGASYYAGAKDSEVTAQVKFESATAFTAGIFTIEAEGLTFSDCSVGVSTGGDAPEVHLNVSNNKVLFAGFTESAENDFKSYTELTLVLKFTVNNYQSLDKAPEGTKWNIGIKDIDITNISEETYTVANAVGNIHIHKFGTPATNNGIITSACEIEGCTETHIEVVDASSLETNDIVIENEASVSFTDTGDTVLNALVKKSTIDAGNYKNVYFVYKYQGDTGSITNTVESIGTVTLDETEYYVFPCYGDAGIGRISQKVTGNIVTVDGNVVTKSADWNYSIKDYAETLAVSGTQAQKNYAKALLNYGYYTATALKSGYVSDYSDMPVELSNAPIAGSTRAVVSGEDSDWSIAGISVTTGFKPKMNIRFAPLTDKDTITIRVKLGGDTVYSKDVAVSTLTGGDTYVLSDVKTKYLTGDIVISTKSGDNASAKTITYSYGRYAKAREGKDDANVFQALMNWSYYLGQAF